MFEREKNIIIDIVLELLLHLYNKLILVGKSSSGRKTSIKKKSNKLLIKIHRDTICILTT